MPDKAEDKGTRNKKEKRQLILASAVQEFSRNGYHNTRMKEIAQRAGIGKSTIYEYFESKLKLFQAMIEDSVNAYYERMGMGGSEPVTIQKRLVMMFEAHLRFCLENKELTKLVFWDPEAFDNELHNWVISLHTNKLQHTAALLNEGIKRGEIRSDLDLNIISMVILHSLSAFSFPLVIEEWEVDPGMIAKQQADMIMNGIRK
ncbi:MAG: TetR/AcrR family transcriptional regulator [Syntrophomonas sp.]